MGQVQTIAVVGAGFSGSLLAVQLLRRTTARVVLIERAPAFGLGLAYGTTCPAHLLNVRSRGMSAFPDDPAHFVRWLETHSPEHAGADNFAPRLVYGRYVRSILEAATSGAGDRLKQVSGEAASIETSAAGATVILSDGRRVEADRAVLALGNPPPDNPGGKGLAEAPPDRWLSDPWAPGALDHVKPADEVLLIGTGLTMIDVVLALQEQGWIGHALALSRRGLVPRPHDLTQPLVEPAPPADASLSRRIKDFRRRAREHGWGAVMDQVRPFNQAVWRGADPAERKRFLRHLRPWWDVHRHRTARNVGERVWAAEASGALGFAAGRIVEVTPAKAGVWVEWRPRGEKATRRTRYDRVINCTGPLADLSRSPEPLPKALLASGLVRIDPYRQGIEVDGSLHVIGADGKANPRLFAVGPITRSEAWEVVAVPEIRGQAAELAERLGRQAL